MTKLCPFILCSVTHWCQCRLWKKRPNKHLHNSTKHGSFEHLFWHKKSHLDTCFNFSPWLMYNIPQCTTICGHWKFDIKLSPFVNYIISFLQCCILWGFEIFKWVKFGPRRWTKLQFLEIFEYDRDPFKLPHVINKFGTILFIMNWAKYDVSSLISQNST